MKTIGRYQITGRLGRGGMSTVYKAKAPTTGRTVALKVLSPRDEIFEDLVGATKLRHIFLEEARIMGAISHDHVAKILDCDESNGAPFIVLEYFPHSIGSLIGEAYQVEKVSRVISINKAYHYIRQSLLGLERLHFAGIIHRDIKPFNLMITNDDRIKIIDFGLSRVRGEEKMAIPGMQVGSPYYAAPEQEQNPTSADERADLFSLGIMAYRMVTGQLIINSKKEIDLPSSLNPDLSPEWDSFLIKAIRPNRAERFPSAQVMRNELERTQTQWKKHSEGKCRFMALDQATPRISPVCLRQAPQLVRSKHLKEILNLDELMRPKVFPPHRFEFQERDTLHCLDTNLIWQRSGSGFPLTWTEAHDYVDYLNHQQWQNRSNWRLPTVEELHTLLQPPTLLRDFCLENHLPDTIHWIWSCDSCTKKKAWTIDISESFFQELDKDGMASVCAVAEDNTSPIYD